MEKNVRVYGVEKASGWDMLNRLNVIPKTVKLVYIAWADGKGDNHTAMSRDEFLANYKHSKGCEWVLA